jgi:nucleoside-diphosphate-sugar epimerase
MERTQAGTLVAVTGAGGFIALHCIRELLERGYSVRGTVRDLASENSLRKSLLPLAPDRRLTFAQADLLSDAGWEGAFQGVTYVLHVASPVPKNPPKDEQDVIRPAREGTLRVLAAARAASVARVVMTSSIAAIASGCECTAAHVFDENDWADLAGPMSAYEKSKTLAERAAWDFAHDTHGHGPDLVVLNPGYVLGPSLTGVENTSNEIVGKLLRREVPGCARIQFPLVDVRDVATAHVLAMTTGGAAGERILLVSDSAWMREIAAVLAAAGYKVPMRELPDFVVRLVGVFDPTVRLVTHQLSKPTRMSTAKARALLGWSGRSIADMVLDTAKAMTERRRIGSRRLRTG